jgi:V8-like Glu-specific endopeptidase
MERKGKSPMQTRKMPKMPAHLRPPLATFAMVLAAAPVAAHAQTTDDAAVRSYWTPERLAHATPMLRHPSQVWPNGLPYGAGQPNSAVPPTPGIVSSPAQIQGVPLPAKGEPALPTDPADSPQQLYGPKQPQSALARGKPQASAYGYYYTTTRVFPDNGEVENFPYRVAGHLFFTIHGVGGVDPPGDYQCTASVIKAAVIVTAAHCVGSPITSIGGHFFPYSNWLFVPADMNGIAPFGSWTANGWGVSGPWSNGNGSLPQSEDWGFLAMNSFNGETIGTRVGNLGYSTYQLAANNVTVLGYPGNLDNAAYMEQTQAQIAASGGNNTYLIGSAMGAGSSGGPWIMDFGQAPSCAGACPAGIGNGMGSNYLVAVTSYGPANAVGYQGASNLNNDWLSLLSKMCAMRAGNC